MALYRKKQLQEMYEWSETSSEGRALSFTEPDPSNSFPVL